ncbi:MAG: protoporphyrinogen oxidase HemJ [Alphaproteobacteria bacterium]
MLYDWIKALHVIAVMAWMAGMLYLPRLFVYHADAVAGSDKSEIFKVMERRLLRAIINPAMIAAFVFGIWMLVLNPELLRAPWLHAKLALVLAMTALRGMLARWRKAFAQDRNRRAARFYRVVNEAVTVLMIGIVILVIVRPF